MSLSSLHLRGRRRKLLVGSAAAVAVLTGVWMMAALHGGSEGSDAEVREFLAPWYEALDEQQDEAARVVVVGDSISEGAGMSPPVHRTRMVGLLQDELRRRMDAPGAAGFIPAFYADVFTSDDTVRGGAPAQEYLHDRWGLGGRALGMPETATLRYPPLPARRVRVWYGAVDPFGGQARVLVDGVDVTAAGRLSDGVPSPATISSSAEAPRSGLWWESADLGPGEHVVEVVSGPGGVFVHTGVEFLDPDAASGIHVYDGSHSGATTADFAGEQLAQGHWREVAALDPQLVLVNLGSNPDPRYPSNLEVVVRRALEAAPRAQVLVVDGYEPGNWDTEAWDVVRAARREVVALDQERVAVFDLSAHWPRLAKDGSTNEGLMIEDALPLHPNEAGNQRMAEIFAELLAPSD